MTRRLGILLISVSTLLALKADFQGQTLTGSLGDILQFGWRISHDASQTLVFSEVDLEGTGIEVLDRALQEHETETRLIYHVAVYDSVGLYTFPSQVVYAHAGVEIDSLFLRGPDIQITSILTPSDTTFRDIKNTHEIRTPLNLTYVLLFALLLLLGYGGYRLFRKLLRRSTVDSPIRDIVPPEEAHVVALKALESLKRSKYVRFEQYKEFYSELTHILKQYYEDRFLIDALEQTTSEFRATMETLSDFDEGIRSDTMQILEKADLIKFAKAGSDELESGKALNLAVDLVNRTKVELNQGDNT